MILIRKNSSILPGYLAAKSRNSALFPSSHFLSPIFFFFTSEVEKPSSKPHFIGQYLIDSVGLSPKEAINASKFLTHIKSPSQPDAVLHFFKQIGFTDADIKRIVSRNSKLLCSNVNSSLKPKMEGLSKLGFSGTQISKLVIANPLCFKYLTHRNMLPRVEFLRGFLRSNDDLVKAFSTDTCFLSRDLKKKIAPSIDFLRECQIPDAKIWSLMTNVRQLMGRSRSYLESVAIRIEELGIPRGSKMFCNAFHFLHGSNADVVNSKTKLLVSLGFSKAEVSLAIQKQPCLVSMSEKNLRETVMFLVNQAGCEPSYVIRRPTILGLSLPGRLIPRNYVLQLLKEHGLLKKKVDFYNFMVFSEKNFYSKFIFPYQKDVPRLHEDYKSASAGKFSS